MYNFLLPELVQKIYEYDNTYHLEFEKITDVFRSKFIRYFTTDKGNIFYIYKVNNDLCLSIQSPSQFYKNLYKSQIYLLKNIEYSKNWSNHNKLLGVKLWFPSDHIEFQKRVIKNAIKRF
jgi:hypothetical protein